MARRSSKKPLYELMRTDHARRPAAHEIPADAEGLPRLGPVLRLPVGLIVLAFAGVMVLAGVAYMLGYLRAQHEERLDYEARFLDDPTLFNPEDRPADGGPIAALRPADSLPAPGEVPVGGASTGSDRPARGGGGGGIEIGGGTFGAGDVRGGPNGPEAGIAAPTGEPEVLMDPLFRPRELWGALESDPREAGRWYAVLVYGTRDKGVELARFCRARGLEAYVPPDDNPRLASVIVLPGFESGARSAPDARLLFDRIELIGAAWRKAGGSTDLGDAYLLRRR